MKNREPWLVWLRGLSVIPQTERLTVQFSARAHAGHVPCWGPLTRQCFSLSLSLSLPFSLKTNK